MVYFLLFFQSNIKFLHFDIIPTVDIERRQELSSLTDLSSEDVISDQVSLSSCNHNREDEEPPSYNDVSI